MVLTARLFNLFDVFVDQVGESTMVVANFGEHEAEGDELLRVQLLDAPLVIRDGRILDHL